jgi:hypothetical protein
VLLLAMAALLSGEGSAALPPPNADPQQPVSFWQKESVQCRPVFTPAATETASSTPDRSSKLGRVRFVSPLSAPL